jgi:hypothetical protein
VEEDTGAAAVERIFAKARLADAKGDKISALAEYQVAAKQALDHVQRRPEHRDEMVPHVQRVTARLRELKVHLGAAQAC